MSDNFKDIEEKENAGRKAMGLPPLTKRARKPLSQFTEDDVREYLEEVRALSKRVFADEESQRAYIEKVKKQIQLELYSAVRPKKKKKPKATDSVLVVDKAEGGPTAATIEEVVKAVVEKAAEKPVEQPKSDENAPKKQSLREKFEGLEKGVFQSAFPTLARLTQREEPTVEKGESKEDSTGKTIGEKIAKFEREVFQRAFPTISKMIALFESDKKEESRDKSIESMRSVRSLEKSRNIAFALDNLTNRQEKTVDLLKELLEVVKGLKLPGRPGTGGEESDGGNILSNVAGMAGRAAPYVLGGAAVVAAGVGGYAAYNALQNRSSTDAQDQEQREQGQVTGASPEQAQPQAAAFPQATSVRAQSGTFRRTGDAGDLTVPYERTADGKHYIDGREVDAQTYNRFMQLTRSGDPRRDPRHRQYTEEERARGDDFAPEFTADRRIRDEDNAELSRIIQTVRTQPRVERPAAPAPAATPAAAPVPAVSQPPSRPTPDASGPEGSDVGGLGLTPIAQPPDRQERSIPRGATPVILNGRMVGYRPEGGGPTVTFDDASRQELESARSQIRSGAPVSRGQTSTAPAVQPTPAVAETEEQIYSRLLAETPQNIRDDVDVQNDLRSEAALIFQRNRQQATRSFVGGEVSSRRARSGNLTVGGLSVGFSASADGRFVINGQEVDESTFNRFIEIKDRQVELLDSEGQAAKRKDLVDLLTDIRSGRTPLPTAVRTETQPAVSATALVQSAQTQPTPTATPRISSGQPSRITGPRPAPVLGEGGDLASGFAGAADATSMGLDQQTPSPVSQTQTTRLTPPVELDERSSRLLDEFLRTHPRLREKGITSGSPEYTQIRDVLQRYVASRIISRSGSIDDVSTKAGMENRLARLLDQTPTQLAVPPAPEAPEVARVPPVVQATPAPQASPPPAAATQIVQPPVSSSTQPVSQTPARDFGREFAGAREARATADQDLASFRERAGPSKTRESRDGLSYEEYYDKPEDNEQFQALRNRAAATRNQEETIQRQHQFAVVGVQPRRDRLGRVSGMDESGRYSAPNESQMARMIELLKSRYNYTDEQLQSLPGMRGNFIEVNGKRYPSSVVGLFERHTNEELTRSADTAMASRDSAAPTTVPVTTDRVPPVDELARPISNIAADREPQPKEAAELGDTSKVAGLELLLRAKKVEFKGDEIIFKGAERVSAPDSQVPLVGGLGPMGSLTGSGGSQVAASGGGPTSATDSLEGRAQQGATSSLQEGPGSSSSEGLTFAPGVDPRINDSIAQKVKKIEGSFGKTLTITSGYRDKQRNAAAGGASNSAHTRANAVDIKFRGNEQDTIKAIEAASEAGVGGIGVYRPGWLHLDSEARRVWGPDFSARSIPEWAKPALQAHMSGQRQSQQQDAQAVETEAPTPTMGAADTASGGDGAASGVEAQVSEGGGTGEALNQASTGSETAATLEASTPTSGMEVVGASQENAVAERTPAAPTQAVSESTPTGQASPGVAAPATISSPNDPGPVEPDDAAERYAKLFNMAA